MDAVSPIRLTGRIFCVFLFFFFPAPSYDLTKDELLAKISLVDAIVIRSATKVRRQRLCMRWCCAQE